MQRAEAKAMAMESKVGKMRNKVGKKQNNDFQLIGYEDERYLPLLKNAKPLGELNPLNKMVLKNESSC